MNVTAAEGGNEHEFLALDTIAGTAFRSTAETDDLAQYVKNSLGFGAFNIPARLAIARSLAILEPPPRPAGEPGRSIKGETLFGTGPDLAAWISLIIEHLGSPPSSMRDLQTLVTAHWARGMKRLESEVRAADGDANEFWRRLAESALPAEVRQPDSMPEAPARDVEIGPVRIQVGEIATDVATGEKVQWVLNGPGASPHSAFMGGVGSGKTRTAAFILRAAAPQTSAAFIAFDFKGDMTNSGNALDKAFGARIVNPPNTPIPLDVFAISDSGPHAVVTTAQRVKESLSNLKQSRLGDAQQRRLNDALEMALRTRKPCTLTDVRESLKNIYAEEGAKEDGAVGTLVDLCRLPLFEPTMTPAEFFSQSWIISLPADTPQHVSVAVVSLVTDALERYINALPDAPTDPEGNRALRVLCVVDEAHRILGKRLPGLANLIRLGRSKGAAVMLISQQPDDFEGEDDDFLAEMGLIACFATNAKESSVKRILGAGASLTTLKKGEVLVKTRGDAKAKKVLAWQ